MNANVITFHRKPFRFKQAIGISILVMAFTLSGCSSHPKQRTAAANTSVLFAKTAKPNKIQRLLSRHYEHWKRTPYKLGGTSKRGIDCSAFVQITYRDVFDKRIPRSTQLQEKSGHSVSRKNLRLGDLVFFRTGRRQKHVGIYIGKNQFMHASTSRGVMLSKLNSPYWAKTYWKAKRILSI